MVPRVGPWRSLGTLTLLCATLASPDAARPERETVRVYATVTDQKGAPVSGLTKDNFRVRLGAVEQEVLVVEPAREPLALVVLTDRLGLSPAYQLPDVADALRGLARAIRGAVPESRVAVTTFDGTVLQVTRLTSAPGETDRALGRLATNAEDAVLFDGLDSACGSMRSAPGDRRIIFTLLAAYRPDRSTIHPDVVVETLRRCAASLWVVEVRQPLGGNYSNPVREQVLDAGSMLSGGTHDVVSSRSGLASATRRLTDLILAQYAVTFGPGEGGSEAPLMVEVNVPGAHVLAPRWTSR